MLIFSYCLLYHIMGIVASSTCTCFCVVIVLILSLINVLAMLIILHFVSGYGICHYLYLWYLGIIFRIFYIYDIAILSFYFGLRWMLAIGVLYLGINLVILLILNIIVRNSLINYLTISLNSMSIDFLLLFPISDIYNWLNNGLLVIFICKSNPLFISIKFSLMPSVHSLKLR